MGIDLLGHLRILASQVVCPSGPAVIVNLTYLWVAHGAWVDHSGGTYKTNAKIARTVLPSAKCEATCSQSISRAVSTSMHPLALPVALPVA